MTKKIVIGNWKMNPSSPKEAEKLFIDITKHIPSIKKTEVVICPPFLYLERLHKVFLKVSKKVSLKFSLGAQNAFWADIGPFTGEVSPDMLCNVGVKYVILGHSERRAMGESNKDVNKKIKMSLLAGLIPIVCVGEKERDSNHEYFSIVKGQVEECFSGISKPLLSKVILAYEPVWALSTTPNRRDATSSDSHEMVIFIRKILSDITSPKVASLTRVIYGGSVTEKDAFDFLKNGGVDGVMPGRASLDAKKFVEIIKIAESIS